MNSRRRPKKMLSLWLLPIFLLPYVLLLLLSLGSGWTYPNLLPDRLDMGPWRELVSSKNQLWRSIVTTASISFCVATFSTLLGMWIGKQVQVRRGVWMFVAYLPFTTSPVVIGLCLLDLFIRLGLASSIVGVFLIQSIFATAFAIILFSEFWSPEVERLEQVVETLGGSRWQVWRHAVWPRTWKLTLICWLQTFLFSWLDYGLVSTIGGGVVPSLTMQVIGYVREASVNQAAQAAVVLIVPPIFFMIFAGWPMQRRLIGGGGNA